MTAAPVSTAPAGIAERPAVEPEVLAVLAAAVDQAWPRPRGGGGRGGEPPAAVAVQRPLVVEARHHPSRPSLGRGLSTLFRSGR